MRKQATFYWDVLCFMVLAALPAGAANSGLDTPTGTTSMPFGIEGVAVMNLTPSGLGIGIGTGTATGEGRID